MHIHEDINYQLLNHYIISGVDPEKLHAEVREVGDWGWGFRYSWLKMACTFSVPNSDSSWLLLWWIKRFFSPWTVLAVGTETGLVLILSWLVITYSCQILTASLLFGFLMLIVIVYCLLLESDHQQLSIEKYEHWCCHLVFRDDRSRLFNILVYYT